MDKVLSVKQLNGYIKGMFDDELLLHDVRVEGEIFEINFSGANTFIVLKEDDNILSCVSFSRQSGFSVGDKIILTGDVTYYARSGNISFIVKVIKKIGLGTQNEILLAIKKRLLEEGIFSNRKQLPLFIKKVALITSIEGAVIHDFSSIINEKCPIVTIYPINVSVQGKDAEKGIIDSLNTVDGFDVVVLARGGGAKNDLDVFNRENVARAVFNCKLPVISAIGHEIDYTLSDFASSARAGTPSIAAEIVVKQNELFYKRFYSAIESLKNAVLKKLSVTTLSIMLLGTRLRSSAENNIVSVISRFRQNNERMYRVIAARTSAKNYDLKRIASNLYLSTNERLNTEKNRLKITESRLSTLNPLSVSARGYAKVFCGKKLITSVNSIQKGDSLTFSFYNGIAMAEVTDKKEVKE